MFGYGVPLTYFPPGEMGERRGTWWVQVIILYVFVIIYNISKDLWIF